MTGNRRRILLVLGVALSGGSLLLLNRLRQRGRPSAIAEVVERRLGFLASPADDRERFARDFARRAPMAQGHLADRARFSEARIEALEERICASFLLSTDFFRNGADETRPVRYLSFHEPTRAGCLNPFARFDLD